ncbi:unnamed protein product, partial [Prorocentrum cordatum]
GVTSVAATFRHRSGSRRSPRRPAWRRRRGHPSRSLRLMRAAIRSTSTSKPYAILRT